MTETFAERLKRLRLRKNYNQKDLAEKIGVADKTISVWERGVRTPDVATCKDIAFALDTSYEYLVGLSDDPADDRPDRLSDEEAAAEDEVEERETEEHFLKLYRELNPETQHMVRCIIGSLYRTDKELHRLRSQMAEASEEQQ